jgi:hypothetical protein
MAAPFAHLAIEVGCPFCAATVLDVVWFQWGFCRSYELREELVYHVGDAIRWKRRQDGALFSWVYFSADGRPAGANMGDPTIVDLIVTHPWPEVREVASGSDLGRCPSCRQPIGGTAVEIRAGLIRRAWMYAPHEFDSSVSIYLLAPDGSRFPLPEWTDHPMPSVPG